MRAQLGELCAQCRDIVLEGVDAIVARARLGSADSVKCRWRIDGLWFARPQNPSGQGSRPLLWIQTDDGAFTDKTNNQMLAAFPGVTGDGGARTITNTGAGGATATQATRVGAPATAATLKRFLVGPKE